MDTFFSTDVTDFSPITPAILGVWVAGNVIAVDRNTRRMHIDYSPVSLDSSDNILMPIGQKVEFANHYDEVSETSYWQLDWLPIFPSNACQYPFLQFHCIESESAKWPMQNILSLEFTVEINSEGIDFFSPVGAPINGRVYSLRCGSNDEWTPQFYVNKNRQSMWSLVANNDYERYYGLQEYHRIIHYKHY